MRSGCQKLLIAGLVVAAVMSAAATDSARSAGSLRPPAAKPRLAPPSLAALPVAFVENRGQTDAEVRYYVRGDRYGFYFTNRAIVLAFLPADTSRGASPGDSVVASLQFVGASPHVQIEGAQVPASSTTCTGPIPRAGRLACGALGNSLTASSGPE